MATSGLLISLQYADTVALALGPIRQGSCTVLRYPGSAIGS